MLVGVCMCAFVCCACVSVRVVSVDENSSRSQLLSRPALN